MSLLYHTFLLFSIVRCCLKYLRYNGEKDVTKTFVLPTALTNIGNYAFYGCNSAVFGASKLPAGITNIGNNAFAGCKKLTGVTLQTKVKTVGDRAFSGCTGLKKAVISKSVTSIGSRSFENCTSLQSLTLPYAGLSADYVAKNSYTLVYNLFNSSVPEGMYNSSGYGIPKTLTTITITGGSRIPNEAFYGMTSLKTINIPESVTAVKTIGTYAFGNCLQLSSITVPRTIESIGDRAFTGCKNLKTVVIKDGVVSIGSRCFENCTSLQSLTLPYAGLSANYVTNNSYPLVYNLFNGSVPEGMYSSSGYGIPKTLTTITITGGTRIPNEAFYGMTSLKATPHN